ncbi:MAG: hypothetical protein HYZ83_06915 [Candidatus Omnitrophica bacterium]|nr:hypothetical protein [Candidatus Omnitrophota bacterium]
MRIIQAIGTAKVLTGLARLGGVRIKNVLQAVRNEFAESVEALVAKIDVKLGQQGKLRIARSAAQKLEKMSLDEVAEAFNKKLLTPDDIKDFRVHRSADEVNDLLKSQSKDPKFKNPYKAGSPVIERITVQEETYVRFSAEGTDSGPIGKWLVKKSEVQGLSPQQIKNKLGLEFTPTDVTEVKVPAGIKVRQGIAGEVPEWSATGGGFQTQLMEDIPLSSYDTQNTKKIGSVFQ